MTATTYALPCCRCGGPVPLDGPEPPGTLAMHAECSEAAHRQTFRRVEPGCGPAGVTHAHLARVLADLAERG